ncbi:hypothetical protein AcdelDRAFT_0267 [Acidovorax delafieldii 2AN]|uniref:Uncharacterized protein n=1 Tax=Acidovorax delafieldii 2AN TaxID=573060 RepID=C5T037_ACIDE|nr:hypothetical protein [Acidovorax delafieldii]EER62145.1 hypothetical protein AcdelDRAFT_0267 [Acidovorax delafieldii 2AN]
MGPTPYQYLPLWAKIAIERLDRDAEMRSESMLDEVLDSYAMTYGEAVDAQTRDSARHICRRRFIGSYTEPPRPEPVPPGTLRLVRLSREGALCPGDLVATQRLGECEVTRIHSPHSIEVRDPSTGRHYLISGVDFGPDARVTETAVPPRAA